ncbi:MAG TPA: LacI family DNA-binding transcriptional regulator [Solirubrobacteraceae bacterium]|jgi:DNA-binding LacI/PurR family transcriptional regulator|nr:LacI family DNA-binding transcriptional regulator [Solirubrobacteraceae bacterium]
MSTVEGVGDQDGEASQPAKSDNATASERGSSRPVTIRDVAALSGVSMATVTRALQGSPRLRPETRERVLESAKRLGYRPDSIARTLVTGTSGTIGVLIPSLVEPYWAEIAAAIEQRAAAHRQAVLLASSQHHPEHEQEMLEMLFSKRVDGIIVGAVSGDPNRWPRSDRRTPIVMIEWDAMPQWDLLEALAEGPLTRRLRDLPQERVAGDWFAHVSTDDAAGGAQIARHLLDLGHTRFAFLVCPPVRSYLLRLLGMRITLEEAGLELTTVVATTDSFEGGHELATRLLSGSAAPTALVCGSDAVAVGAIKAAHEMGVHVPADVSITGYDDIELAAYVDPPLTTLRNPMRELGQAALDLLLRGRAGERGPISHRLTGELRVRDSTGPAPAR